jgi:hypothetical protein
MIWLMRPVAVVVAAVAMVLFLAFLLLRHAGPDPVSIFSSPPAEGRKVDPGSSPG